MNAPQSGVLVEKIDKVMSDPNRSAQIALVASGEHKRYIIATDSMKEGDAVKSTQLVSRSPGWLVVCYVFLSLSMLSVFHTVATAVDWATKGIWPQGCPLHSIMDAAASLKKWEKENTVYFYESWGRKH